MKLLEGVYNKVVLVWFQEEKSVFLDRQTQAHKAYSSSQGSLFIRSYLRRILLFAIDKVFERFKGSGSFVIDHLVSATKTKHAE